MEDITIETGEAAEIKTPSIFDIPGVHRDKVEEFAIYHNIFDANECKDIINYYKNNTEPNISSVGEGNVDKSIRNCTVYQASPEQQQEDLAFIFERIREVVVTANQRHFHFDLTGPIEPMQFLEYNGEDEQHYIAHSDRDYNTIARKLSLTVLLTDPEEFEGGELRFPYARDMKIKPTRGSVLLFPSFTIHEVTPVTKGIRNSLVMWVAGPSFR
jgi:PKHD-type hydroxylase